MRFLGFICLLFWGVPTPGKTAGPVDEGWRNASIFRANQAQENFVQARQEATTPEEKRQADFGEAVSLLNVQPKTDGKLDRAVSLFQTVRAARADDEMGVASLYFRARVEQYQRLPADLPGAVRDYRELWTNYPTTFWGQQAAIRLALIEIYSATTQKEEAALLAKYEMVAARLTDPQTRRDMYTVLGRTYMNLGLSPERALDDLLRTQEFGFALSWQRAGYFVRIAELARKLHRNDVAILYETKLIDEFPFDSRAYMLKERRSELTSPPAVTRNP